MNFKATLILSEALRPYTGNSVVDISSDDSSDFVTVDATNHIGFEVFENEIIAFFFTDHCHFEDYSSTPEDGEDYISRAKDFLGKLLENEIRHLEYYKGKTLSSEKYFIVYGDGREDECIGNTWFGLLHFINPFGKKRYIRPYGSLIKQRAFLPKGNQEHGFKLSRPSHYRDTLSQIYRHPTDFEIYFCRVLFYLLPCTKCGSSKA